MSGKKDESGFTEQERHQAILDTIKERKKTTKVFHLRWCPGDLLNGKILLSTPVFWYMRFGWTREDIETLFFKARVYIDQVMMESLNKVFGSDYRGPRWTPPSVQIKHQARWKKRGYKKTSNIWWKTKSPTNMHASQVSRKGKGAKDGYVDERSSEFRARQAAAAKEKMRRKSIADRKLAQDKKKVWNAVSDFGADKRITAEKFRENMKERGVTMNPYIAQKLFEQCVGKDSVLDEKKLEKLLKELDAMKVDINSNIGNIKLSDLENPLEAKLMMKRVLLASSMDMPFHVDEFMINKVLNASMAPGILLGKLATRECEWDFRAKAMEDLSKGLGSDPQYNEYFEPDNMSNLLMGWMTQTLDERKAVSKPAIDALPHVYNEMLENGDEDTAIEHLEDVLEGLFKVMDNPRYKGNRKEAEDAIKDVVDNVAKRGPDAVLYATGLLTEQLATENNANAAARKAALDNLKRLLFGEGDMDWEKIKPDTAKEDLAEMLPDAGTAEREYVDIASGKQKAPSNELMESMDEYSQKGRRVQRSENSAGSAIKDPRYGYGSEESSGLGRYAKKPGDVDWEDEEYQRKGGNLGDLDEQTEYGGANMKGKNVRSQQTAPRRPRRKKGKQSDMSLRFGRRRPRGDEEMSDDDEKGAGKDGGGPGGDGGNGGRGRNGGGGDDYTEEELDDMGGGGRGRRETTSALPEGDTRKERPGRGKGAGAKGADGGQSGTGNAEDDRGMGAGRDGRSGSRWGNEKSPVMDPDDDGDDEKRSPENVGDDLRSAVRDALGTALEDPNKSNAAEAAKLAHLMNQAQPGFTKSLDKDAQRKYFKWKTGPLRGGGKSMPRKKLPGLNVAERRLHKIDNAMEVTIAAPVMPDI